MELHFFSSSAKRELEFLLCFQCGLASERAGARLVSQVTSFWRELFASRLSGAANVNYVKIKEVRFFFLSAWKIRPLLVSHGKNAH